MSGWLFAQAAQPVTANQPDLAPLVRRIAQGNLASLADSTVLLALMLIWLGVFAIAAGLLERNWTKWLRGLFDIRGHFEQLASGLDILRRNKRPLWMTLAGAVLSWTGWSLGTWRDPAARTELESMLAQHENSAVSFATSHAFSVALVPLRSLLTMADLLPLMIGACLLLFARTPQISQHLREQTRAMENVALKRRLGTIWVGLIILVIWRIVSFVANPTWAPIGDCLFIDIVFIPLLLLVGDGLLLSWVLAEYGRGVRDHFDWQAEDTAALVRGITPAMIACALTNPGRYLIVGYAMWEVQVNQTYRMLAARWEWFLFVCAVMQIVGLVWFTFPSVLAVYRRRGIIGPFRAYIELLRRAGGKVVGLTALGVALQLLALWPFYWIFASMQVETWSLIGAASYGQYASLLVSLVLLAGMTQLAQAEIGLEEEPGPVPVLLHPPTSVPRDYAATPAS